MAKMNIVVTHRLPKEVALERIKQLMGEFKEEYKGTIRNLDEKWDGDKGTFAFTAMSFTISGAIIVDDEKVEISGTLPRLAGMFKSKFEETICSRADRLLSTAPEMPAGEVSTPAQPVVEATVKYKNGGGFYTFDEVLARIAANEADLKKLILNGGLEPVEGVAGQIFRKADVEALVDDGSSPPPEEEEVVMTLPEDPENEVLTDDLLATIESWDELEHIPETPACVSGSGGVTDGAEPVPGRSDDMSSSKTDVPSEGSGDGKFPPANALEASAPVTQPVPLHWVPICAVMEQTKLGEARVNKLADIGNLTTSVIDGVSCFKQEDVIKFSELDKMYPEVAESSASPVSEATPKSPVKEESNVSQIPTKADAPPPATPPKGPDEKGVHSVRSRTGCEQVIEIIAGVPVIKSNCTCGNCRPVQQVLLMSAAAEKKDDRLVVTVPPSHEPKNHDDQSRKRGLPWWAYILIAGIAIPAIAWVWTRLADKVADKEIAKTTPVVKVDTTDINALKADLAATKDGETRLNKRVDQIQKVLDVNYDDDRSLAERVAVLEQCPKADSTPQVPDAPAQATIPDWTEDEWAVAARLISRCRAAERYEALGMDEMFEREKGWIKDEKRNWSATSKKQVPTRDELDREFPVHARR